MRSRCTVLGHSQSTGLWGWRRANITAMARLQRQLASGVEVKKLSAHRDCRVQQGRDIK